MGKDSSTQKFDTLTGPGARQLNPRDPSPRDNLSKQGAQDGVPYQSSPATPNKNVD